MQAQAEKCEHAFSSRLDQYDFQGQALLLLSTANHYIVLT